jgi:hypothetical protein
MKKYYDTTMYSAYVFEEIYEYTKKDKSIFEIMDCDSYKEHKGCSWRCRVLDDSDFENCPAVKVFIEVFNQIKLDDVVLISKEEKSDNIEYKFFAKPKTIYLDKER